MAFWGSRLERGDAYRYIETKILINPLMQSPYQPQVIFLFHEHFSVTF
jgi:hypothetical protein